MLTNYLQLQVSIDTVVTEAETIVVAELKIKSSDNLIKWNLWWKMFVDKLFSHDKDDSKIIKW